MPLERQTIDIPLGGGRNAGVNPHLVQPGQMLLLENGYHSRDGELRRRGGTFPKGGAAAIGTSIHPSGTLSTVSALIGHGKELLLFDKVAIAVATGARSAYQWASKYSKWIRRGFAWQTDVSWSELRSGVHAADAAYHATPDAVAAVFVTENIATGAPVSAVAIVIDNATGERLLAETTLDASVASAAAFSCKPRVIAVNSTLFVLTWASSTSNIRIATVTNAVSSSIALSASANLETDRVVNSAYAIAGGPATAGFYLLYADYNGGSSRMVLRVCGSDGTSRYETVWTPASTTAMHGLCVVNVKGGDADGNVYVFYRANSVLYCRAFNDTGSALSSLFVETTITPPASAETQLHDTTATATARRHGEDVTAAEVYYDVHVSTAGANFDTRYVAKAAVSAAGTVSSNALLRRGCSIHSQVYSDGCLWVRSIASAVQATTYTLHLVNQYNEIMARALVEEASGSGLIPALQSGIWSDANGPATLALKVEPTSVLTWPSKVAGIVRCNTAPGSPGSVRAADQTYIGGAAAYMFDGRSVVPSGFCQRPYKLPGAHTTGGSLTAGAYAITHCWYWKDANGNEHYSAPSNPRTVTVSIPNNAIAISWMAYNHFDAVDKSDIKILIFRTLVNAPGIYYLDRAIDNGTDKSVSGVAVTLTDSDATIADNLPLYIVGGEVENTLPPTPLLIASDGDAAYLVPGDDRETIWVSKPISKNKPIEFSQQIIYRLPEGGDITAVSFIDRLVVLFKANQIRALIGGPPNAQGLGGFTGSQLLDASVGAVDQRGVLRIPDGVIFRHTSRGFWLLDRSLQVSYIGLPVKDHNAATVTSAVLLEDIEHARFSMSTGITLNYDYRLRVWSVFTAQSAVDSCVYNGKWAFAQSNAVIGLEATSSWASNDDTVYALKFQTPWIKPAFEGWQRIDRIALLGYVMPKTHASSSLFADTITIKAYHNYDENTAKETIVNAVNTATLGGSLDNPFDFRVHIPTQKCAAIMFEVTITSVDALNEGLRLTGLSLSVGVKRGLVKKGSTLSL